MVNEIEAQLEMAHRTPGAYEAALFDRFVDVMRDHDPYERVVFDTAPTGATLRLLELPGFLEGWIDRLMDKRRRSIDLFEKAAIGDHAARTTMAGDPILAHLRERKEFFEFAGGALRNDAAFLLVLNPDQLSVNETDRTVESLRSSGLGIEGLVANKLTPSPDPEETGRGARYLRERIETERDRLDQVRDRFDPPLLAEIEFRPREIRGDLLVDVADELGLGVDVEPPTFVTGTKRD
jgi:arsenite-transporting ATPase